MYYTTKLTDAQCAQATADLERRGVNSSQPFEIICDLFSFSYSFSSSYSVSTVVIVMLEVLCFQVVCVFCLSVCLIVCEDNIFQPLNEISPKAFAEKDELSRF